MTSLFNLADPVIPQETRLKYAELKGFDSICYLTDDELRKHLDVRTKGKERVAAWLSIDGKKKPESTMDHVAALGEIINAAGHVSYAEAHAICGALGAPSVLAPRIIEQATYARRVG